MKAWLLTGTAIASTMPWMTWHGPNHAVDYLWEMSERIARGSAALTGAPRGA